MLVPSPPSPTRPSPNMAGRRGEEKSEEVPAANTRAVPPDTMGKVTGTQTNW